MNISKREGAGSSGSDQRQAKNTAARIRSRLLDELGEKGIPVIVEALTGAPESKFSSAERLRAFNIAARYCLIEAKTYVLEEMIEAVGAVAGKYIKADDCEAFSRELIAVLKYEA